MDDYIFPQKLVPALQQITATRICVILYIRDELIEFVIKQRSLASIDYSNKWREQKERVSKLIPSLNVPELLKKKISHFNKCIGDEIFNWITSNDWIKYRPDYGDLTATSPLALTDYLKNCLVWTSRNTIHYEKTARQILRSEYISKEEQFHLACDYCFEDVLKKHDFAWEFSKYESSTTLVGLYYDKLFLYYWICRFIPEKMSKLRSDLELENNDNIHLCLLPTATNPCAVKYCFDKLDLIEKEEAVFVVMLKIILEDYEMKAYFISQVSVGTRQRILREFSDVLLNDVNNSLWHDYVLRHFNTYGPFMTTESAFRILHTLLPCAEVSTFKKENVEEFLNTSNTTSNQNQMLLVYELWSNLSQHSRTRIIEHYLRKLFPQRPYWVTLNEHESPLTRILLILLNFNDTSLVNEILTVAENATVQLRTSNAVKDPSDVFSIDDEPFKLMVYYPRQNRRHCWWSSVELIARNLNLQLRLYLVHELVSSKFLNGTEPLQYECLKNSITDVFVEYCRSGEVACIENILNQHFKQPSDKTAYKSSLLHDMFHKLLTKAVSESYYFLSDSWDSVSRQSSGIHRRQPPPVNINRNLARLNYIAARRCRFALNTIYFKFPVVRIKTSHKEQVAHRTFEDLHGRPIFQSRDSVRFTRGQIFDANIVDSFIEKHLKGSEQLPFYAYRDPVIYSSNNSEIIFSAVESFLNWYFNSKNEINEFKLEIILNERLPAVIEMLLTENKTEKLKQLLFWFLSNYERESFKQKCQRNELTSLL